MTTPTRIVLNEDIAIRLLSYSVSTHNEFSGLGFCHVDGDAIVVYDFVLLHVGNYSYTHIEPEVLLPLLDRPDAKNMKVWIHKHPMGNGEPGSHNWSSTDHDTCTLEPLGGVPEMVKWSAAVVITPKGWVGRVDNHITHRTIHLPVLPEVKPFHSEIDQLEPRCRTQEKTFEDWQGDAEQGDQETSFAPIGNYRLPFPRGVVDVDTAFIEPYDQLVLDTAGYFSALDLERINWTRSDLLVWISDDLAQYRDDLQDFVVCERDHIRSLIGGY